jgi:hypothetical protein
MSYNPAGVSQEHHDMVPGPAGVATVRNIFSSESGVLLCYGTTFPPDSTAGYAPGCIFQDTDSGTLYCNVGTKASSDFNLVTVAA